MRGVPTPLRIARFDHSASAAGRLRVHLVSRSSMMRAVESQALSAAGAICTLAASLDADVDSAPAGPDLVVVDGQGCDPEALQRWGRERDRGVPAMLIATPQTPTEVIEAGWDAGIDDLLFRPLRINVLRERLAAVRGESTSSINAASALPARILVASTAGAAITQSVVSAFEPWGCSVLTADLSNLDRLMFDPTRAPEAMVICSADPKADSEDLARGLRGNGRNLATVPTVLVAARGLRLATADAVKVAAEYDLETLRPAEVARAVHRALGRRSELKPEQSVPFFCPIEFREWGRTTAPDWSTGFTHAISPAGVFVRSGAPVRVKAPLEMRIHLTTTRETLTATGVVAWSTRIGRATGGRSRAGMGVQFLGATSQQLKRLIEACREASL